MADVSQSEFCRAARGGAVIPGAQIPVEPFILGIRNSAGAAVRRVHTNSPGFARSYYARKTAHHFASGGGAAAAARAYGSLVEQYITWDVHAAAMQWPPKRDVGFGTGNNVRARADVVLDDGGGGHIVRVLLWDELPLTQTQAEMIALPALEQVEMALGAGSVSAIEVWQLSTQQQERVLPAAARSCRAQVQQLLTSL